MRRRSRRETACRSHGGSAPRWQAEEMWTHPPDDLAKAIGRVAYQAAQIDDTMLLLARDLLDAGPAGHVVLTGRSFSDLKDIITQLAKLAVEGGEIGLAQLAVPLERVTVAHRRRDEVIHAHWEQGPGTSFESSRPRRWKPARESRTWSVAEIEEVAQELQRSHDALWEVIGPILVPPPD
jgi:hypothetical protein